MAARQTYAGVTYSSVALNSKHQRYWIAQFRHQKVYGKARRLEQADQVAFAGKRLAELHNSVWPWAPARRGRLELELVVFFLKAGLQFLDED